jgi:catechol 2,3-dioxygenase-like lactoylglutathione lyase family enzyme
MKRVTGIGGIFFKTRDAQKSREWYARHLGIEPADEYGAVFAWRSPGDEGAAGHTVWAPFPPDTRYFGTDQVFMVNYRVENLAGLLETLRAEGVDVDDNVEEAEYGKFGWITDPDGLRVELWEPPEKYDFGVTIPME